MSSVYLCRDIKQILIDIKSDKTTVRSKSLNDFQQIIDDRSEELHRALTSDDEDAITWNALYFELHEALKEQCVRLESCRTASTLNTMKNKNDAYKSILTKCINVANERDPNIPLRSISDSVFDCFESSSISKYFDTCYLKITYKHILNTKFNLVELKVNDWSRK